MGKYLDIARQVSEELATNTNAAPDAYRTTPEANVVNETQQPLLDAGWIPRTRRGKVIWVSPLSGYWYGEEVAKELLRLDDRPRAEDLGPGNGREA